MIPEGLITYTSNDLEAMAAVEFRRRPEVAFNAPINLELLIEHLPDVRLEIRDNLLGRHKCEGCVCKEEHFHRQLVVLVDHQVFRGSWANYNAVLAEEYAHLRLHRALFDFVITPEMFHPL